eukprot:CAMPEP_0179130764 /NCGR_PEP_ID=MMETSP0796-20121207/62091_1 /TAXON_ID=73915 /ORGANISM="Pyrodinium bahamense, Strain pbaha01" /LENGTH=73 /DNA_ID=CAMNT_0020829671 /DNA_START=16 /DNA_END=237 /DNA_ORIENTATION=-
MEIPFMILRTAASGPANSGSVSAATSKIALANAVSSLRLIPWGSVAMFESISLYISSMVRPTLTSAENFGLYA